MTRAPASRDFLAVNLLIGGIVCLGAGLLIVLGRLGAIDLIAGVLLFLVCIWALFQLKIMHRRSLEEAAAGERRLRALLGSVPGIVWEAWGSPDSKKQRINFVSDYVETLLGYTVQEWLSTPRFWLSLVHPEDRERAAAVGTEIFTTGKLMTNVFRMIRKDGSILWAEAHAIPIYEDGLPVGMRGMTIDISARVLVEQKLSEAIRTRDDFLSIASHELKTPLSTLNIQMQLLGRISRRGSLSTYPEDKLLEIFGSAAAQIKRICHLVEDLLDVSRIHAKRMVFRKEEVDIFDLSRDVVARLSNDIRDSGSSVQFLRDGSALANCDRLRIEQVITNLLTNALKYGNRKPVHIDVWNDSSKAVISVRDFGIGISQEDQQRIFDRFERAVSSRHFGGLGLGLYISRQIVDHHGGSILVDSEPGRGSCFRVELPHYS
jgi:PAS domain S-box-containing protein